MAITVEYHRPGGANPGDVRSTALIEGTVGAGTTLSIHSVPCYTPVFSLCGFSLRWKVCERGLVATEDLGEAGAEPEPAVEAEVVACDAILEVTSMGVVEDRFRARGFPFVDWIELDGGLVWDRRGGWVAPTADDFFTRQVDAWADADGGVVDPDGGLDDGYDDAPAASWGGEAWDGADVY